MLGGDSEIFPSFRGIASANFIDDGTMDKPRIMQAIRAQAVPPADLPELNQTWITFADRRVQFAEMLQSVGGQCAFVERREQIADVLRSHSAFANAQKTVSLVLEATGNVQLESIIDPHGLEDVDIAILPGQFAVAENAAVWITDLGIKHRAVYFVVQHLVLVIDGNEIVHNMHEAYQRLRLGERGFGAFISGPSKTADIEQSLVIGAHGPRSLLVICVGTAGEHMR